MPFAKLKLEKIEGDINDIAKFKTVSALGDFDRFMFGVEPEMEVVCAKNTANIKGKFVETFLISVVNKFGDYINIVLSKKPSKIQVYGQVSSSEWPSHLNHDLYFCTVEGTTKGLEVTFYQTEKRTSLGKFSIYIDQDGTKLTDNKLLYYARKKLDAGPNLVEAVPEVG